ncbi:MAG: hypothetical protein FJX20_22355 [Alphaproteobacteria bacterium]|nr:hypothetical protein [Alphaproteobacteria bacterium]
MKRLAVSIIAAGLAAPAAALAGSNPGSVSTGEFACFRNDNDFAAALRLEWPDGRWALYAWPAKKNLRLHVGPDDATWCWRKADEAPGLLGESCGARGRTAMKGCDSP